MILLISFLLLISMIAGLFLGVVFPIWTIIDCAVSERKNQSKVAWIISMILLGFIAGFCYVIWGTKNKVLKIASFSSFILILLFGVTIVAGTLSLAKTAMQQVDRVLVKIDDYTKQLTVEQTDDFRNTLIFVSERLHHTGWHDFGRRLDYIDVADQLNYISRDKSISENDYLDIKEMVEEIKSKGIKLIKELSDKRIKKSNLEIERQIWKKLQSQESE